ncbi:hypothetical protein M8A51_20015 [Schlegelella sp. S2-27]|uniref:Uncharacterized protein n=1 Tax=Caldimonas mangrovi TaxID=2944811 RepID=A0ABT0YSU3_9BURK|nr:hypothetical protein [Caldimonas mangrovi]MCM5681819.1 hypothetical protein [Caldimonas mangrovi]
MRYLLALAAAAASLVTGCSDPKAASEKNFEAAIQSYLDTAYPKCYFNRQFPTTNEFDIGGSTAVLQAMARAGLLVEKEASRKEVPQWGGGKKVVVKSSFDLTDEGRKFYKPDAVKTLRGEDIGGFCFGRATVTAITQFSEPADMFGHRISRVSYTYTVSGLPDWAKAPEMTSVLKALQADAASAAEPVKALDALVLTNTGWVHEKLFKKP